MTMARGKRTPRVETKEVMWRALDIPKSEWIEMYLDLYRQANGETLSDEEAMQDAEHRREILFGKLPKPAYRHVVQEKKG
jgi:hypothetical protein